MLAYRIPRHGQAKDHRPSREKRRITIGENIGPQLPLELYHHIIGFIAHEEIRTLRSLALVSRSLQPEAESHLYHTLRFSNRKLPDALLRALISSSRRASYVRRIWIRVSVCNSLLLRDALQHLFNLISLSLEGYRPIDKILLSSCHFPRLEAFEWVGLDDESVYMKFFEAHPQLLDVHVEWPGATVVTPNILPNVRTVSGSWNSLRMLLPGRKITKVKADAGEGVVRRPTEKGPFPSVHTFFCVGSIPIPKVLELFPHVEVLKLQTICITADIVPQLCQAQFLTDLTLGGQLGKRVYQIDRIDLAERLFDSCARLKSVGIRDPVEGAFLFTRFRMEVPISFEEFWEPYE
ncbi:hypothetical protein BDN72DRAFT_957166 [Pluteus cervinus]|uniref:Uncharacterized protein n=1 Tax=Pluteus cervinus TaxID=181527 RepID=A0ACD3B4D4_9AGAR|nr:hypothetical protein BDN72DRAFT_957166 [Pluteus cervinus]